MSLFETIILALAIIAATAAAIANHFTPELAAFLGVAVGYAGKGILAQRNEVKADNLRWGEPRSRSDVRTPDEFKGSPE